MTESPAALQSRLADRLGSVAEARWVVEELLGRPLVDRSAVNADLVARADALVERRLAGEPLQYLLGTWAFRSIELSVDRRALIPRPETEQVAEVAMAELHRMVAGRTATARAVAVDLGTGTGAIALSMVAELAGALPGLEIWATDLDTGALALAAENLTRLGAAVPGLGDRVHLVEGRWYGALPAALAGRVDLVVSNPPYVAEGEWEGLDAEVRAEPYGALVAGPSSGGVPGMAAIEAVLAGATHWLAPSAAVVVELAPHQAVAAAALAAQVGLGDVRIVKDLADRNRAVVARRMERT